MIKFSFRVLLCVFLLLFCINVGFSQQRIIAGQLIDRDTRAAIAGARLIFHPQNKVSDTIITDALGRFRYSLSKDTVGMLVKHLAYVDTLINLTAHNGDTLIVFAVKSKENFLKEVNVNARRNSIQFDGEKMMVGNNFFRSTVIDGWEALGTIPGINVSNGNGLTMNGRSDVTILFNDQKVTLTLQQAMVMLKSMQPNMIERVEVTLAKNARYEAQGSAGVINIVTKKPLADRFYVYLNSSLIADKFLRANQNVNVYFKYKTWSGYSALGLTNNINYSTSAGNSVYGNEENKTTVDLSGKTENRDLYLTSNIGLNYDPDKNNSFGLFANLNKDFYKSLMGNYSKTAGLDPYELDFENKHRSDGLLNTINFNYMRKTDSLGSYLKILAGRIGGYSKDKSALSFDYNTSAGSFLVDNRAPMDGHQYIASLDLSKNINKKLRYDTGVRYTRSFINNSISYDTLRNDIHYVADMSRFALNYEEEIFAAYVLFTFRMKKMSVVSGVRFEDTSMDNDYMEAGNRFSRDFSNFFPSLALGYNSNKIKSSFNINRSLQRPNFEYINNYVQAIDRYTSNEGNPFLRPAFTWDFSFNNYLFNMAFLNVGFSTSRSTIIKVIKPQAESLVNIMQPNNALNMKVFYLSAGASGNITKSWDAQINFSGNMVKNTVKSEFYANSGDLKWNTVFYITVNSSYALGKTISVNNYFSYNAGRRSYQTETKSNWQNNLSFSKMFPKNWKVNLLVTDVFHSYRNSFVSQSANYYSAFQYQPNSTRLSLSVSYFFGKLNSSVKEDNSLNKDVKRFNKDKAGN